MRSDKKRNGSSGPSRSSATHKISNGANSKIGGVSSSRLWRSGTGTSVQVSSDVDPEHGVPLTLVKDGWGKLHEVNVVHGRVDN